MRHLVLLAALAAAVHAPVPAAAQESPPAAQQQPAQNALPAAARARSDSLARAALAATAPGKRLYVDVRTPEEFAAGHLPGAINIPVADLEQRWTELKSYPQRQIVLYCRSGHRAGLALEAVKQHGIANAVNGGGLESLRALLKPVGS
ncbi:MAG TPA: rhodanese-like domain-containing protein [Longimicrobiales bacterium]